MTARLFFSLLLFTMPLCHGYERPTVKSTYSEDALALLAHAERTEIFRLTGTHELDRDEKNWARGPVWGEARTREVVAKLLSDDGYLFSIKPKCEPRPGMLMRLFSGKRSIEVRLCFECSILELSTTDPKFGRTLHFSPSRSTWARWAKEAFPKDPVIQGLHEKDTSPEEKKRLDDLMERSALELEARKAQKDGEKK